MNGPGDRTYVDVMWTAEVLNDLKEALAIETGVPVPNQEGGLIAESKPADDNAPDQSPWIRQNIPNSVVQ